MLFAVEEAACGLFAEAVHAAEVGGVSVAMRNSAGEFWAEGRRRVYGGDVCIVQALAPLLEKIRPAADAGTALAAAPHTVNHRLATAWILAADVSLNRDLILGL